MIISAQTLVEHQACTEQVRLFTTLFGDRPVEVTEELCVEHADKFAWPWGMKYILKSGLSEQAFEEGVNEMWAVIEAHQRDRRDLDKKAQDRLIGTWLYESQVDRLWRAYNVSKARAFAKYAMLIN